MTFSLTQQNIIVIFLNYKKNNNSILLNKRLSPKFNEHKTQNKTQQID